MLRKKTRQVMLGKVSIGGNASIKIQSMANTDTRDIEGTIAQINALALAGCQVVRLAVPDSESAEALAKIIPRSSVPLVADIHFDHQLALAAIAAGVQGLRINPGNIGEDVKVRRVAQAAQEVGIPIRIGVNGGSLQKDILATHVGVTPMALVESAERHIELLEKNQFYDIKLSLKSSSVPTMIEAYRLISSRTDYPLHLGVTEAGSINQGLIKSAIGIGTLLAEGIGDTLRVSLTADPLAEVKAAKGILQALELENKGITYISCPTCGRTEIDLIKITAEVEKKVEKLKIKEPLKVALMGCVVNGPGEAKEADIGIAGGRGSGVLFKKGKVIRKLAEKDIVAVLVEEIKLMARGDSK